MTTLSHPVLAYGVQVIVHPAAEARRLWEKAYNLTVRLVTDCDSNDRARAQLGWPEWSARASALRRAFVMRFGRTECLVTLSLIHI